MEGVVSCKRVQGLELSRQIGPAAFNQSCSRLSNPPKFIEIGISLYWCLHLFDDPCLPSHNPAILWWLFNETSIKSTFARRWPVRVPLRNQTFSNEVSSHVNPVHPDSVSLFPELGSPGVVCSGNHQTGRSSGGPPPAGNGRAALQARGRKRSQDSAR
jgi:hypothetical protein